MSNGVKASKRDVQIALNEIKRRNWTKTRLSQELKIARSTVTRFFQREPIQKDIFQEICQLLNIEFSEIELVDSLNIENKLSVSADNSNGCTNLSKAPDTTIFYGRELELELLQEWVIKDKCRLVALLGMGGIGKTALCSKLAKKIYQQFDFSIWISLREAPPIKKVLFDLLQFLSDKHIAKLPDTTEDLTNQLLHCLEKSRCLVVFDNAESILSEETKAGDYKENYEDYGKLIEKIATTQHQSCLIFTSREKPKELVKLGIQDYNFRKYGITSKAQNSIEPRKLVKVLLVQGLDKEAGKKFLDAEGLQIFSDDWKRIFDLYSGNPLALKIVVTTIQDLFGGSAAEFLRQKTAVFGNIRDLLDQQFERLSVAEKSLMYWLAINREPTNIEKIEEDMLDNTPPNQKLIDVLSSLKSRYLIERLEKGFTLQNVVMEYTTEKFIEKLIEEINNQQFFLFNTHALLQTSSNDYVREDQIRLIMQPIKKLVDDLEGKIISAISIFRQNPQLSIGYAPGNALNLLCQCGSSEVCDLDLSGLTLRKVDLNGMKLHSLNLSNVSFIQPLLTQTFSSIYAVDFSPDGKILATGDGSGDIQLWNIEDRQKQSTFEGHTDWIWSVAFSSDGQFLASGSDDSDIRLWNVKTKECLYTFSEHTSYVWSVAFSPDGRFLASGSEDSTVRLWDIQKQKCLHTFSEHTGWIWSVAFSPDGQFLASGSADSTVRLWNLQTKKCLFTLSGHQDAVRSVAFSPDGQFLASGSEDSTIRLWDIQTQKCLHTFSEHAHFVRSVAFSPDGQFLASGSEDSTIRLWDIQTQKCLHTFSEHTHFVRSVAFSPDGNSIASSSADSTVRLWDVHKHECLHTFSGYKNFISSVAFSPDGQFLVSGSEDSTVRLWNLQKHECLHAFSGHTNIILSVAFSPNGRFIASSSEDSTIRLWDVYEQRCLRLLQGETDWVSVVVFSPNSYFLASNSDSSRIWLWDLQHDNHFCIDTKNNNRVSSIAFSPDGQFLASGSADSTVRLWNLQTKECLFTLSGHQDAVQSVAFSPDGQFLASGSADSTVRLWNLQTKECLFTLSGHQDAVRSVAFSPDGQFLASGSADSTVRLWDIQTQKCLHKFLNHTDWVTSIAFSPSAKEHTLASGSQDGTIRLWKLESKECIAVLRELRPYEGTNITGVNGLNESQWSSMLALGAVDKGFESSKQ